MNFHTLTQSIGLTSMILFALTLVVAPALTHAKTTKPTCTLTTEASTGIRSFSGKADVFLVEGEEIEITWKSTDATKVWRGNGDTLTASGTKAHSPSKTSTYSYHFSNGNSKTTCSVTVHVVTGGFDESSLQSLSSKPAISGTASGTRTVQIQIFKEGSDKPFYVSKSIKVKKGEWDVKVNKKLPNGTYNIVLFIDKDKALSMIAEDTLVIGKTAKKTEKTVGTIAVVPVPLLLGGTARAGASIPVSYLQVINIGKDRATLRGFTIKQNGSASTDTIIGLTVSDDSGMFHNSVNYNGTSLFKNGTAFVPIEVPIVAGQMRLFTIKAILANTVTSNLGKQLKIDITGVDASAELKSKLPVRGTTWTFGF